MIPKFGGITGRLPAGIHSAAWVDVEKTLGFNSRRKELLFGLLAACHALKAAGVTYVYIDGSFSTKKANPGDWDACYDAANVDPSKLDPVLLDFTNERAAQKAKYKGEMFPASDDATGLGEPYLTFFQHNKEGKPKGIVALDLGTLP
jgi:hypothetical protein